MNKLTSSQQFSFCFTIITNLRTPFTLSHHLSNEFNGNLISDVTLGDNGEDEEVPEDPGEEDLEIEVDPPEEQTDEDSANTEVDLRGIDPNVRALINSHQTEREQWKRKMEEIFIDILKDGNFDHLPSISLLLDAKVQGPHGLIQQGVLQGHPADDALCHWFLVLLAEEEWSVSRMYFIQKGTSNNQEYT